MEIRGDFFRLRPFEAADAGAVQQCFDDPVFVRFLDPGHFPLPFSASAADAFIQEQLARASSPGIDRAILVDGALAGAVHLFPANGETEDDVWEIALLLSTGASGRRVGTELVPQVVAYAFENLGAFRVVATAHPHNVASRRVMEKSGLRLQRIAEEARTDRAGQRVAQVHYAIDRPGGPTVD